MHYHAQPLFAIYPVNSTFDIGGVQQMMGFFTARLTQVVLVKFLNIRVLIGLAQQVLCIQVIKHLSALGPNVHKIADPRPGA